MVDGFLILSLVVKDLVWVKGGMNQIGYSTNFHWVVCLSNVVFPNFVSQAQAVECPRVQLNLALGLCSCQDGNCK